MGNLNALGFFRSGFSLSIICNGIMNNWEVILIEKLNSPSILYNQLSSFLQFIFPAVHDSYDSLFIHFMTPTFRDSDDSWFLWFMILMIHDSYSS